jgi:hypothetical protein
LKRVHRRSDPSLHPREASNKWLAFRGHINGTVEADRAALKKLLESKGYDAVRIRKRGGVTGSIGGNQLVVLDPRKATVVNQ